MIPLFNGAKLKVKRADQHISELQQFISEFLKTDFCRIFIEVDPNDGNQILKFQSIRDMPHELPLVIGDVIHNLRSALDLMTCEIVTMAGESVDRNIEFLVRDDRDKLITAINDRKIKAAPKSIIDLIVDTIKPYKGGNDALCALHDLDILDKHKLLIPVASVNALMGAVVEDDSHNVFNFGRIMVGPSGKLNLVKTASKMKITKPGQPAFALLFDKGYPFEGQPVIPTLHQLSQLVSGILQTIEKAYLTLGKDAI